MIESVVLIEGQNVNPETLGISLGNAKQLVIGRAGAIGVILHVAANPADLGNALVEFALRLSVMGKPERSSSDLIAKVKVWMRSPL